MDKYIEKALVEAELSYSEGNVPVGAVIVKDNSIIASNHNRKNSDCVSIYHAELLSIVDACRATNSWYLDDCIMYVTLKPCMMCAAAIAESRIKKVVYLLDSNYTDNLNSNINSISFEKIDGDFNNYSNLLSDFFKSLR